MKENPVKRAIDSNFSSVKITNRHIREIVAKTRDYGQKRHRAPAFPMVIVMAVLGIGFLSFSLISHRNEARRLDSLVTTSNDQPSAAIYKDSLDSVATATAHDQIEYEFDLFAARIEAHTNGGILLAGHAGDAQNMVPQMICLGEDGMVKWELTEDTLEAASMFRDAIWLDDNTIIALRHDTGNQFASFVELIENGAVLNCMGPIENAYRVFRASDGFIVFCKPDFSTAKLIRMNLEGEELWQIELPEPIMLNGLLSYDEGYIVYGQIEEGRNTHRTGLLLAFDDQGNVQWRHDGTVYEEYVDAVLTEQGDIVLIGNAYGEENPDDYGHGFITSWNARGQNWKSDYIYTRNQSVRGGKMQSITRTGEGYLVAARVQKERDEIKLLFYDKDGILQKDWSITVGIPYVDDAIAFFSTEDRLGLITNGTKLADDLFSFDGKITIMKDITLPFGK